MCCFTECITSAIEVIAFQSLLRDFMMLSHVSTTSTTRPGDLSLIQMSHVQQVIIVLGHS